jgi:hypothetical protein
MIHLLAFSTNLTVSLPSWAQSNHAKCFFYGLGAALMVRLFRFMLRSFKRAGREDFS